MAFHVSGDTEYFVLENNHTPWYLVGCVMDYSKRMHTKYRHLSILVSLLRFSRRKMV